LAANVIAPSPLPTPPEARGGGSKRSLRAENDALRAALAATGLPQREALQAEIVSLGDQAESLRRQIAELEWNLVETNDKNLLQEVGIYEYAHPLDSSVDYKSALDRLKGQIKQLVKDDDAVSSVTQWTVNGSAAQGRKMVRDISKLMLRAYNAEADNCVRSVRPSNRDAMLARLSKTRETIAKLGTAMQIRISDAMHRARLEEIRLTADFRAKQEEEKEAQRQERAELREAERAAKEIAAAQAKLETERQKYATALAQLEAIDDATGAAELRERLAEIDGGLAGLAERAANTRAGHVYVISNLGAFGERVVKIGMTRRLEPMDRVRELGDASVPFKFDVHALFFSDDAVGLETALHQRFAHLRVNLVNQHREFFYVSPIEVKEALHEIGGHVLEFAEFPEAEEYRISEHERNALGSASVAAE
jgi:hypothetical protein